MDKETISHDDVVDLIGERPFEGDKAYKDYVSNKRHREDTAAGEEEKKEEVVEGEKEEEEVGGGGNLPPLGLAFKKSD